MWGMSSERERVMGITVPGRPKNENQIEQVVHMSSQNWLSSNVAYGQKLVASGLQGANHGRAEFLQGRRLCGFAMHAASRSLLPAAGGLCLGALAGYLGARLGRSRRAILWALGGGTAGFGAAFAWKTK